MRDFGVIGFSFSGDRSLGAKYVSHARTRMGIMNNYMLLHGLPSCIRHETLPDGTKLSLIHLPGGIKRIHIDTQGTLSEYDYKHGIVCIPSSDEVPDGWGFPYKDENGDLINPPLGTEGGNYPKVIYRDGSIYRSNQWFPIFNNDLKIGLIDWQSNNGDIVLTISGHNRYFNDYLNATLGPYIFKDSQIFCSAPIGHIIAGCCVNELTNKLIIGTWTQGNGIYIATFWMREYQKDGYENDDLYDENTNPSGWKKIATIGLPTDDAGGQGGSLINFNQSGDECVIVTRNFFSYARYYINSIDGILNLLEYQKFNDVDGNNIIYNLYTNIEAAISTDITGYDHLGNQLTRRTGWKTYSYYTDLDKNLVLAADYKGNDLQIFSLKVESSNSEQIYQVSEAVEVLDTECGSHPPQLFTQINNKRIRDKEYRGGYKYYLNNDELNDFCPQSYLSYSANGDLSGDYIIASFADSGWIKIHGKNTISNYISRTSSLLYGLDLRYGYFHYEATYLNYNSLQTPGSFTRCNNQLFKSKKNEVLYKKETIKSVLHTSDFFDAEKNWSYEYEDEIAPASECIYDPCCPAISNPWWDHSGALINKPRLCSDSDTYSDVNEKKISFTYSDLISSDFSTEIIVLKNEFVINAKLREDYSQSQNNNNYYNYYNKADIDGISKTYATNKKYTIKGVF